MNTRHGSLSFNKRGNARERGHVLVLPDAQVLRSDSALGRYGTCFHYHQSYATRGAAAQVNQMPVRGEAILTGVLAHRGDGNPIAHGDVAQGQRGEKRIGVHSIQFDTLNRYFVW